MDLLDCEFFVCLEFKLPCLLGGLLFDECDLHAAHYKSMVGEHIFLLRYHLVHLSQNLIVVERSGGHVEL
jgi:hypothetical protein